MNAPRAWLPRDALGSDRVAKPFGRAVGGWSERWFPGNGGWASDPAFVPVDFAIGQPLRRLGSFDLLGKSGAILDLAFALLGETPQDDLTEDDRRLLRRLAARALDDLASAIQSIFSDGDIEPDEPASWQLPIGPARGAVLAIACGESALAALGRAQFPVVRKPTPLVGVQEAVEDVEIATASRIGTARLSIAQIDSLAAGDVLLLDERAESTIELLVEGQPTNLHFAMARSDDRLTLTMQE